MLRLSKAGLSLPLTRATNNFSLGNQTEGIVEMEEYLTRSILFFERNWGITQILDYLGTLAFAISGARLAAGKKIDLFGAFVVGLLTAVGGGTIRDLMLGLTPFWLLTPAYILISFIAFLTVVLFRNYLIHMKAGLFIFDAIGLGLFTVVGIERALMVGLDYWVAIMMGVITGAFGGLLRDICLNEVPLIFRKDIYAIACLIGGVFYWLLTQMGLDNILVQIFTALVVILSRYISMKHHLSLPILEGADHSQH